MGSPPLELLVVPFVWMDQTMLPNAVAPPSPYSLHTMVVTPLQLLTIEILLSPWPTLLPTLIVPLPLLRVLPPQVLSPLVLVLMPPHQINLSWLITKMLPILSHLVLPLLPLVVGLSLMALISLMLLLLMLCLWVRMTLPLLTSLSLVEQATLPPLVRLPLRETSPALVRSEEHTSELQSPDHLVCRLLLEKKKQKQRINETAPVAMYLVIEKPYIALCESLNIS